MNKLDYLEILWLSSKGYGKEPCRYV